MTKYDEISTVYSPRRLWICYSKCYSYCEILHKKNTCDISVIYATHSLFFIRCISKSYEHFAQTHLEFNFKRVNLSNWNLHCSDIYKILPKLLFFFPKLFLSVSCLTFYKIQLKNTITRNTYNYMSQHTKYCIFYFYFSKTEK